MDGSNNTAQIIPTKSHMSLQDFRVKAHNYVEKPDVFHCSIVKVLFLIYILEGLLNAQ